MRRFGTETQVARLAKLSSIVACAPPRAGAKLKGMGSGGGAGRAAAFACDGDVLAMTAKAMTAKRFSFLALTGILVMFGLSAVAQEPGPGPGAAQSPAAGADPARPHIVAAEFYSGWCGVCRLLEPKLNAVRPAYENAPIDFVKFDFTWGKKKKHKELAAAYGVTPQYERFKRGQGYVVFIDPASGLVLDVVTGLDSRKELEAAFARAARAGSS